MTTKTEILATFASELKFDTFRQKLSNAPKTAN